MAAGATRSRLRAVLIDLSGTLHIDDQAIPGAVAALQKLRKSLPVQLKFVTNTTKESVGTLHTRLTRLGFDIERHEIFSSLTAARSVVRERGYRPLLLLQDDAKEDFKDICTDDPNSVVVGLSPDCFNYDTLNKAFRLVLDGKPLIAIHKAKYYMSPSGLALGPGAFVEGLEYATGAKAMVIGKPETAFFMEALKSVGCKPDEAVMIGDDVAGDIEGAQRAGIKGFLVNTGKYRHGDEKRISPRPAGKYRPGDENRISPPPAANCLDFPAAIEFLLSTSSL